MMALDVADRRVFEDLLRNAQQGRLPPQEESRLRSLVAKLNPPAEALPYAHLVAAGMTALGVLVVKDLLLRH